MYQRVPNLAASGSSPRPTTQATQGGSSCRNDGPVKPSIREMIEAAPRRLPRAAVAVEHDHRVAGHDAADACHRHAGIGARNLVASFACCREAQFVIVATAALQDMALVGIECGQDRQSTRLNSSH